MLARLAEIMSPELNPGIFATLNIETLVDLTYSLSPNISPMRHFRCFKGAKCATSKPCRFQTSAAAAVKPCQNVRLIKLRRVQVVSLPRRDWFRR